MCGRIAQLGEHLPYKQRVTGSSPVVPTTHLSREHKSSICCELLTHQLAEEFQVTREHRCYICCELLTQLTNVAQWLSWLECRPVTPEVEGSSPFWVATYFWPVSSVGRAED